MPNAELPNSAAKRMIVIFVEADVMSAILVEDETKIPAGVRVIKKMEVVLDKSHALIIDGLIRSAYDHGFEFGSIHEILRDAVEMGMRIQAGATERTVVPVTEL